MTAESLPSPDSGPVSGPVSNAPVTTAEKLADLREKLELAKEPGGEKAVAKRDKKGIPSARSRIYSLLDPGSFLEIGALAKTPGDPAALFGDGVVTGHGLINGRPVGVFSHDQTVFQGTVGEMFGRKVARLMEWVAMVGCPIIGINDSGGARIQDAATSLAWYAELGRRHELLRGLVPEISLIFGKCAGGAVYSPIQTDLVVAVRDQGYMFVTGPDVIKDVTGEDVTLDELGGADAQARYGNIHQVVESEAAAFQYVRDYLSFLPANTFDDPPIVNPGLEPEITPHDYELDSIVPDSDNTAYDMHEILLRIFDDGDVFDVAEQSGPAIITGLRPCRRSPGRGDRQPADVQRRRHRQRGVRQGRPLRAVLRLVQHAAGVRRRHPGLHARRRAGEGRHHQAGRPLPQRRRRGRHPEGHDHGAQVLRRRVRGDGLQSS